MKLPTTILLVFACLAAACNSPADRAQHARAAAAVPPPLFKGLGEYTRPIATNSAPAQAYFDQGMLMTIGFNHEEAIRAFKHVQHLDPECAMAYWGEAFALGPNINAPMQDPEVAQAAYRAAQKAFELRNRESVANRALIEALTARYTADAPAERKHIDQAYADRMRAVWQAHPNDPDVGALFADALMNINPWQTWTPEGEPKENILETVAALEAAIAIDAHHPFANHLYIHAVEASKNPERAVPAADRLLTFSKSASHLIHMPAHIYINVGRYLDAEEVNRRAVLADNAYFSSVGPQGMFEFYRAHNHHFLVYAAMFAGRSASALASARNLVADIPEHHMVGSAPFVDGFLAVPLHAMIRFGKWEDVLAEPAFDGPYPIAKTLRHYARGVAFAATGRVAEARREQELFEQARKDIPADGVIGINPAPPVIAIAEQMLEGEILYREGSFDAAFTALRLAVDREMGLRYDEPSPWMQPVRHALGALLLEQGHIAEAEAVYQADLAKHEENGWSLHGLAQCARKRGDEAAARQFEQRHRAAWAKADIALAASCFCSGAAGAAAPLAQGGGCCAGEATAVGMAAHPAK